MSDEPESDGALPDPLSELLGTSATDSAAATGHPVPLVPAQPQFSSRREARDAGGASQRSSARKAGKPGKSVRANSAAAKSANSAGAPSTSPKSRATVKLSRRDQAAIKRLAATPVIQPAPVVSASSTRQKKQNPVKVFFVLLVIAGFVGGVALPAAATGNGLSNGKGVATSYKNAQSVRVSASIETSKVSRDAMTSTSEAELKTEQINAAQLADDPGVRQPGDDYPWRDAGYGLSPLGYYYRQCVDFVAWRLNRDQGVTSAPWKWTWSNLTPWGGDASQWKSAWQRHGWTVSATPIVGSVAWFVGDHVAYVHSISGSNVTIEEYNGEASRAYAERTIPISSVGDFLYPPPA